MKATQRVNAPRAGAWVLLIGLACLGPWGASMAQGMPAGMEATTSLRNVIGGSRDMLASVARQMAAAGQPLDIDQLLEQEDSAGGSQGQRKAPAVDPVIQTLSCPALNARVKNVDAAIEAKLTEEERRAKALDARTTAATAAAVAKQKAISLACNVNPLACLAGALLPSGGDAAIDAANTAESNSLDALRASFNPLLSERTVAVYHLERKACR